MKAQTLNQKNLPTNLNPFDFPQMGLVLVEEWEMWMLTLDEAIAEVKPLDHPPKPGTIRKIESFVKTLGLQKGKLYSSEHELPWIFGNVNDPVWFGDRTKQGSYVITTETRQCFIYLDHIFINWVDSLDKRNYWLSFLKFIVNDKVAYFPVPTNIIGTTLEKDFRDLFNEAKKEMG